MLGARATFRWKQWSLIHAEKNLERGAEKCPFWGVEIL